MKLILTFFLFFLFSLSTVQAQRQYSFNSKGNVCYFQYVCYTADGNYTASKKPFLFILGKPGESAQQAFENDSTKNKNEYLPYLIVYIPNSGATAKEKLLCLDALTNLITYNYSEGRDKLFLFVKDENIKQEDIDAMQLNKIFKSVQLTKTTY